MARRNPNVSVNIDLEADASGARKSLAKDLGKIEDDAKDTAKTIERAFENLSPELTLELDTAEIRQALDLAGKLDGMVAEFTVDTDLEEIKQAEQIARSLRSFQGRVDLSVEGRAELADALDLAEKMDQIRQVKVEVQGREDLEKAARLAEDLEQRRTVDIDVDTRELSRAEAMVRDLDSIPGPEIPIHIDGSEIEREVENAFDGIDVNNLADDLGGRLTGALAGAGAIGSGLALVAEAWGDDLMEGFQRGWNREKSGLQLQIETGFGEADLRPIGEAAGRAYSEGFGEGLQELTIAGATLEASLRGIDENFDLAQAIRAASVLEEHLGVTIPDAAVLAARLIRTELADDTVEAFDIMTYATQTFGDSGLEALEIVNEFSTVFGRLGIDGPAAVDFIARTFTEALVPTMDRSAELLEEFQIRITDLDSEESIKRIGVDFEHVSDLIANGRGAEALQLVTDALLNMKDKSAQATEANIIFGAAMESAYDRPELIARLRDLATEVLNVDGASAKATEQAKEMQTEWDKASRNAQTLADKVGGVALKSFNDLYGGIEQVVDGFGLWGDASDNISGQMEGLGDVIQAALLGPLGTVADDLIRFGGELGRQLPFWQSWWGEADHVATSLNYAEGAMTGAREAAGELAAGTDAATGELEQARTAVEQLSDAFDLFSGRFDESNIMARIEEDTERAIEAVKGLEDGTYTLGTGFDLSTEKGRAADAALKDLSGSLDVAIGAYERGTITGQQLADKHAVIQGKVREVASAMDATQGETEEMIETYARVPDDVSTLFRAETQAAMGAVAAYAGAIAGLPTTKTLTVTTYQQTVFRPTVNPDKRHGGGPVKAGETYLVGGPGAEELFTPDRSGMISDPSETRRILENNPRAQALAGAGVGATASGGVQRIELVVGSDGSPLGNFLVQTMRKEVRNRGGIDVVFNRTGR